MAVRQPLLEVLETPPLLAHHRAVTAGLVPKELVVFVVPVGAAELLK